VKLASFIAIIAALDDAGVRYLVAGGLAVNAHGYIRFTRDVDLVIQLEPDNIVAAFRALATLGYSPTVPVSVEEFADPSNREVWMRTKGMQVLNFQSNNHPLTLVDVFVTEPFDFNKEYNAAKPGEVIPGLMTRFVTIPTLIAMNELAGRPRDIDDVQHLKWMLEELGKHVDDQR
jgi:polynucleotide 5'-kinase involved in rRNA processing